MDLNLRLPAKQRGGSMKVSGYLAFALLALAIGEAAVINYLFHHRAMQFNVSAIHQGMTRVQQPDTVISPDSDAYAIHAFPSDREVCTFADTLCYIKI